MALSDGWVKREGRGLGHGQWSRRSRESELRELLFSSEPALRDRGVGAVRDVPSGAPRWTAAPQPDAVRIPTGAADARRLGVPVAQRAGRTPRVAAHRALSPHALICFSPCTGPWSADLSRLCCWPSCWAGSRTPTAAAAPTATVTERRAAQGGVPNAEISRMRELAIGLIGAMIRVFGAGALAGVRATMTRGAQCR
jgi:hypothetical protein